MSTETILCWNDDNTNYTITRDQYNCDDHFLPCHCPLLEANPDIAGIGVIVAFVVSASLTLLLTILCLLLSRSNSENTFNPFDRVMRHHFCAPIQKILTSERAEAWSNVMYYMVICLSDQQLVTGIALLVAATKLFNDETITAYHFSIATDLVWFSSNTHLLSLLVIRSFNESVKPNPKGTMPGAPDARARRVKMQQYPKLFRAVLMGLLAGILLYTSWISGYVYWYENFGCPAKCTKKYEKGGIPLKWTIVNFVFILFDYPITLLHLWTAGRTFWMDRYRRMLVDEKSVRHAAGDIQQEISYVYKMDMGILKNWGSISRVMRRIYLSVWYFLASETVEVLIQIAWHGLGYYWLFSDREEGQQWMTQGQVDIENELGFGQLVPLLLLLLLVLQFLESYADEKVES